MSKYFFRPNFVWPSLKRWGESTNSWLYGVGLSWKSWWDTTLQPWANQRRRVFCRSPFLEPLEDRLPPAALFWGSAANGPWETAGNWRVGSVDGPVALAAPGATDNAFITLDGTYTVTVSTSQTVQSLTAGASSGTGSQTLAITAGTFRNTAASIVGERGVLNFTGTAFDDDGGLTVNGLMNWSGGTLDGSATTIIAAGGQVIFSGSNARTLGAHTLENRGTIQHGGSGILVLSLGSVFHNRAGGLYDIQSDADVDWVDGTTPEPFFNNEGTVRKSGGTGHSFIDQLRNLGGTVEVLSGAGTELELRSFDGTTNISTGGTFTVAAGGILDLNADIGGYDTGKYQGSYSGSGGGTVLIDNGAIHVGTGATLNMPGTLLQWRGGSITGGTLTNAGTITLAGAASKSLSSTATLTNTGTILHAGAGSLVLNVGSVVNNQAAALYDIQADGDIDWTTGNSPEPFFNNQGTLRKSGSGHSFIDQLANLNGTLDVQLGELELRSFNGTTNVSTGGTFTVASDAILNLTGDISGYQTAKYQGAYTGSGQGQVLLDGGTLLVQAAGVTFNFPANLFQWTGGTIGGSGILTNDGQLNLNLGTTTSLTTKLVNRNAIVQTGTFSLQLNNGTVDNEAGAGYDINSSPISGNAIFNQSGTNAFNNRGTVRKLGNTIVTISVPFNNLGGTIDVKAGTLIFRGTDSSTGGNFLVADNSFLDLTTSLKTATGTYTGSGTGKVRLQSGTLGVGAAGATFNFPANLFQWTGGTVGGSGILTNEGQLNLNLGTTTSLTTKLVNRNAIIQTGTISLQLTNGTVDNEAGAAYDINSSPISGNAIFNNGGTNAFNNRGTVRKLGSTFVTISVPVTNAGTIEVLQGTLIFSKCRLLFSW